MGDQEWLADRFESDRIRLRAVAYRMLGSLAEADDAVQEAWLRLTRTDADEIENLSGWLTTVVGRICLDMLRSRTSRREQSLDVHLPDPIVARHDTAADPEHEAVLADSVGLALIVVLDTLAPPERLAFVLHDMFGVPFQDIAGMLERSVDATKMLASRARRRLRGSALTPDADVARQRRVVAAFFAAARGGDFEALVALLAPDVVLRSDGGPARPEVTAVVRGAAEVAGRALMFRAPEATVTPVLVNGAAGVMITVAGRPVALMGFTVVHEKIVGIDALADPERLAALDVPGLLDPPDAPDPHPRG